MALVDGRTNDGPTAITSNDGHPRHNLPPPSTVQHMYSTSSQRTAQTRLYRAARSTTPAPFQ